MPRLKKEEAHSAIRRLILGYDLSATKLAVIWECSPNTARQKRDNPEKINLQELRQLNLRGHIPLEEIREAIKW